MDLPAELAAGLDALGCKYAFYHHRRGEPPVLLQNQEVFVAASLIKLPILLAWTCLERQQRANRAEICELDFEPVVQGAGLSWLLRTRRLPYHDVLLLMTALSDNLCANVVIRRIGMARLNTLFAGALGLRETTLNRPMMDERARALGRENCISAQDCIRLFDLRDALAAGEREWIEPMLAAGSASSPWLRNLPPDSRRLCHKSGDLPGVFHDWAYTADVDLFLLTQDVGDYTALYDFFGTWGARLL